jgi:hypothetical protein
MMKFVGDRPLSDPETAMRRLLEIANGIEADHAARLQVATVNSQFLASGGTPAQYGAAVKLAIERGFLTQHMSKAFLMFTQSGADLFA